jgi:hypothetical protein
MKNKINLLLGIGVVAMALSMSSSAYAQDIIRTKAGKDIAAKVLEISDEEVSYKLYDNQDGPTIRISTEKLYKIFFENGSEYAFVEEVFSHNLPADAPLQDLVADGNNVYIMMDDPTNSFSEKDKYIREYLREYTPWNVVDSIDDADFILYVEVHMTERFSHVHSATPSIRRPDGTVVWKGRKQRAAPVIQNGFVAVRGVSKDIVREALMVDMWEEIHR